MSRSPPALAKPVSTGVTRHAAAPPVGLDELSTLPSSSTAAQNTAEGQETAYTPPSPLSAAGSTLTLLHAAAPPVGLVEVSTSPASSTATHSARDGQDTEVTPEALSTATALHAAGPPAGLVEMNSSWSSSLTRHSFVETQSIPGAPACWPSFRKLTKEPPSRRAPVLLQLAARPAGLVVVSTRELASTATHSRLEGQAAIPVRRARAQALGGCLRAVIA